MHMELTFDEICAKGLQVYDRPTLEQLILLDYTEVKVRFPNNGIRPMWQMELPSLYLVPRPLSVGDLEQNPGRCLDVLRYCLRKYTTFDKWWDPRWVEKAIELKMGWLEAWRPLTFKEADLLLEKTRAVAERVKILYWRGRRGRPATKRKAVVKAYVLQNYSPDLSGDELTRRFCPCGLEHDHDRVQDQCLPSLKSELTMLRRLLRDCEIKLPEHPMVHDPPFWDLGVRE
jgi:hypothetical protein